MNDKTYKLVCETCGSLNIKSKCWVDLNSNSVLDQCYDGDIKDNWCNDCKNHVNFKLIEQ